MMIVMMMMVRAGVHVDMVEPKKTRPFDIKTTLQVSLVVLRITPPPS